MTAAATGGRDASPRKDGALRKAYRALLWFETFLVCALLFTLIILSVAQIGLRNFLSTGWTWADALNKYIVLWIAMIGASVATRERRHITIDVASRLLPKRARAGVFAVTDLFSAVVAGTIGYACARFVLSEREFGGTAFLQVPSWVAQIILPIGFGIIALRFLVHSVLNAAAVVRGDER